MRSPEQLTAQCEDSIKPPLSRKAGSLVKEEISSANASPSAASTDADSRKGADDVDNLSNARRYEACCQKLARKFSSLNQSQFLWFCCAASLILGSSQALNKAELQVAVELDMAQRSASQPKAEEYSIALEPIIRECEAGRMEFADPAMARFLQTYRVPGIDPSTRSIARVSAMQKSIDEKTRDDAQSEQYRASAFSAYAAEHWERHLEDARRTRSLT